MTEAAVPVELTDEPSAMEGFFVSPLECISGVAKSANARIPYNAMGCSGSGLPGSNPGAARDFFSS